MEARGRTTHGGDAPPRALDKGVRTSDATETPGTYSPVLCYCDEIGTGDDIFLDDRDGVRVFFSFPLEKAGGE